MNLRILDSGTRSEVIVRRPPGGLFRMCLRLPEHSPAGADGLRVLLVADAIRRVLEEIYGIQVQTAAAIGTASNGWERALDALWIPPPIRAKSIDDAAQLLGGPADAVLESGHESSPRGQWSCALHLPLRLWIGPVLTDFGHGTPDFVTALTDDGHDPLALRLALLRERYDQPLPLTRTRLDRADVVLDRWRRLVAEWADHPSAPMPAHVVERAYVALDEHLDIGALVEILQALADDATVRPGAKFETFVHFDRILALELVRYLTHPPA
ncbi:hypothetical protein [Saccharopolyspora hattusasensis]|uniref:hypothetical protein n=1 Tax=Saccharopolyspora hattusasensis TaxID=1128679 RepID=UPI003D959D25